MVVPWLGLPHSAGGAIYLPWRWEIPLQQLTGDVSVCRQVCGFLVNESGVCTWSGASARLVPAMEQLVGSALAEGTAVRLG